MPMFEFTCDQCDTRFEELIFADEIPACPKCGNTNTRKEISSPCIHMPAPSRVGQTVTFPKSNKSACKGCSATSCSTCK